MSVCLRKMTSKEYDEFFQCNRSNQINELIKCSNITLEDAVHQVEIENKEMLPDGINTVNNSLMVIENSSTKSKVGSMWYFYEKSFDVEQVYLCYFAIEEWERRKQYATQALSAMEQNAIEFGCKESVLYVAKENIPAQKLYDK